MAPDVRDEPLQSLRAQRHRGEALSLKGLEAKVALLRLKGLVSLVN